MNKKKKRVAINGFGRIGRAITKINVERNIFDLVMVNDINPDIDNLFYLLKYDSTYGVFNEDLKVIDSSIYINNKKIDFFSHSNIEDLNWNKHDIDIVIDSSGVESNTLKCKKIISEKKIKNAIITHSSDLSDKEIILGINSEDDLEEYSCISSSICDANAAAHVLSWLDDEYGIINGSLTTLHPWLSYQNLIDGSSISQSNPGIVWKDYALGRSSVNNIIPKKTTAMSAIERILPKLKNKIISFSYRIPTGIVASADIFLNLRDDISIKDLEIFLKEKTKHSNLIYLNYESLTAKDYEKSQFSAIIDMQWLECNNKSVKLVLWYDNEWGYSSRAVDLVQLLSK
tara:strand:- start:7168 stop:8199 length:1032 start_codon:yes stop_codon:yes gene_type:complete